MRITVGQLKQIIKEETARVLRENTTDKESQIQRAADALSTLLGALNDLSLNHGVKEAEELAQEVEALDAKVDDLRRVVG